MKRLPFNPLILVMLPVLLAAQKETPADWAKKNAAKLVPIYKELHSHPELSFSEEKTSERLAKVWRDLGLDVTEHVGGFGVVGVIRNGKGATLLLRTDLDALPVEENTGLAYSSHVKTKTKDGNDVGVMHACGHDIHITSMMGVAEFLTTHKEEWSGTIVMIGQPAEEKGQGAGAMLKAGLFEKFPKPDYALALHVDSGLETGKIGYISGFAMATADSVDVVIKGRGGHGAEPNKTIDPIVIASQFVVDLQTLVSRETSPLEPAVITVGSFHCGAKHNIVSDSCHLQITVRSYTEKSRQHLFAGIKRKALAAAQGSGAPEPEVKFDKEATPALYNDPKLVERLLPAFRKALGNENVVAGERAMVSEDFSRYQLAGVPVMMFRLGSVNAKRLAKNEKSGSNPSLHSAQYYPDPEESLVTGISAMSAAVLELVGKPNQTALNH